MLALDLPGKAPLTAANSLRQLFPVLVSHDTNVDSQLTTSARCVRTSELTAGTRTQGGYSCLVVAALHQ